MNALTRWMGERAADYVNLVRPASDPAASADVLSIVRGFLLDDSDILWTGGYAIRPEEAMQCAAVYRCVDVIAGAIAFLPAHVMVEDSSGLAVRQKNHPMAQLLRRPNQRDLEFEYRKFTMRSLLLWGNAYSQVIPRMDGTPMELQPLWPEAVTPKVVAPGRMEYEIRLDTKHHGVSKETLPESQMLHIRAGMVNPATGVGQSVVSQAAHIIGVNIEQEKFAGALFANRLQPGGIFICDPSADWNDTIQDEVRQQVRKNKGRPHRTWILPPGIKYQPISINPNEAQFLEGRRFSNETVANFFGVPQFLMNDQTKSTSYGRGIENQWLAFLRHTLNPWLRLLEQAYTRRLLQYHMSTNEYFRFNTDPITRADTAARWLTYKIGTEIGALSPNDVRRAEGWAPRDGGDEYHYAPGTAMETEALQRLLLGRDESSEQSESQE